MSEPEKVKTGACLCGKVKYKLEGEAATPMWQTVCYCLNCRRRTGSALYTAAICPKNGFTITEGEEHLSTYIDSMTDSGQPLTRQFCKVCGSNMFNFTPLYDIVSVSAGSLDEFDDFKPTLEQYCIHRADFLEKTKGVEKRYIESIAGEMEKDDAGEKAETQEMTEKERVVLASD